MIEEKDIKRALDEAAAKETKQDVGEGPYRKLAEVTPLVPQAVLGPLTKFKKHERSLALLRVYREDIEECLDDVEALNKLKDRTNDFLVDRVVQPPNKSTLEASSWVQELTLEDLEAFDDSNPGFVSGDEPDEEEEEDEDDEVEAHVETPWPIRYVHFAAWVVPIAVVAFLVLAILRSCSFTVTHG